MRACSQGRSSPRAICHISLPELPILTVTHAIRVRDSYAPAPPGRAGRFVASIDSRSDMG